MLTSLLPVTHQNRVFEKIFKKVVEEESQSDFTVFNNHLEINEWASKYIEYFSDIISRRNQTLTSENEESIYRTYSYYAGWTSIGINDYLRRISAPNEFLLQELQVHTKHLDAEFAKFPLTQNIITIRKLKSNHLPKVLSSGCNYVDPGFLSTSLDKNYRMNENSVPELLDRHAIFIIKIPRGYPAIYLPREISNREEYELLLPRNTCLIIQKVIKVGRNQIIKSFVQH